MKGWQNVMNPSDSPFMVSYISFGSNCMLKRSVHTSLDHKMETGYLQHNFEKEVVTTGKVLLNC